MIPRTRLPGAAHRSVTRAVTAAHFRLVTTAPSSVPRKRPVATENIGTTEVTVAPWPGADDVTIVATLLT
jgi:hypothetical protein